MKVSKKILGAVLCGLIVVGGSNATLVKANAQEKWRMGVGFATHMIGIGMGTTYPQLNLVLDNNGNLKLEGSPRVAFNRTFSDTFRIGWKKKDETKFTSGIVFRQCWQADAEKTLRNVVHLFNKAGIKKGDEIFIHGEGNQNSIRFFNRNLIKEVNPIIISSPPYKKTYNPNYTLYENYARHWTAFRVEDYGLQVVQKNIYENSVCGEK